MKITLSERDQMLCKGFAKQRYQNNRKSDVVDKKIGPQSTEFTDLEGIGGEFAYCRLFGYTPDMTIHPRGTKADHGDVTLPDGTIIDIKTTKYAGGRLLAPLWKAKSIVDIYVLMVGTFPTYEYKGQITHDELFDEANIINLGYGKTYGVTQERLHKIETSIS